MSRSAQHALADTLPAEAAPSDTEGEGIEVRPATPGEGDGSGVEQTPGGVAPAEDPSVETPSVAETTTEGSIAIENPDAPGWVSYAPVIGVCLALVAALVGFLVGRALTLKSEREAQARRRDRQRRRGTGAGKASSIPATAGPEPVAEVHATAIGRAHGQGARDYQQDSFGVTALEMEPGRGLLAIVADGMGGLKDGDAVSEAAVKAILDGFMAQQQEVPGDKALLLQLATSAVASVNGLLGPGGYKTSGSTLVMAYAHGGRLTWLSIGDSHAYLLRDSALILLNREHDYAGELAVSAVNGRLSLSSALTDAQGSALTSFLGMGAIEAIDLPNEPLQLLSGDRVILCTDGVYNAFEAGEMQAILAASPSQEAEALGEVLGDAVAAKAWSDQDNYTAVVIGFE